MPDTTSDIKDEAKEKLGSDLQELKSSFNKLRSDVMNLLNDAMGVGKHGAANLKDSVQSTASDAYDSTKERLEDWQLRGEEQIEALGKKIGDHPVQSALIALGVGFILGKLLSR